MVLRDQLAAAVAKQVGGTVTHVDQPELAAPNRHDRERAAHARPVGVALRGLVDGGIRLLARLLQAVQVGTFVAILGERSGKGLGRDGARGLTRGVTAHPVTNDQQGVEPRLVPPDHDGILVFLALETGIGRRGGPEPHAWCRTKPRRSRS